MTARPVNFTFAMQSPLSRRHPRTVPLDEIVLDLEEELDRRRRFYPRQIEQARLTREDADRHLAILGQILDDCREGTGGRTAAGRGLAPGWPDKVRELRREIMLRRNFYPRQIHQRRLNEAEARTRCERLDAAHWRYWHDGFTIEDTLSAEMSRPVAFDHLRRFHAARFAWELERHAAGDPIVAHLDAAAIAGTRRLLDDYAAHGLAPDAVGAAA